MSGQMNELVFMHRLGSKNYTNTVNDNFRCKQSQLEWDILFGLLFLCDDWVELWPWSMSMGDFSN